MSERLKARWVLNPETDKHGWLKTPGEIPAHMCGLAPACGLPADSYEANVEMARRARAADDLFVSLVLRLDWGRVIRLAVSRHEMVHDGAEVYMGGACEECIRESLLCDETAAYGWEERFGEGVRQHPLTDFMPGPVADRYEAEEAKTNG